MKSTAGNNRRHRLRALARALLCALVACLVVAAAPAAAAPGVEPLPAHYAGPLEVPAIESAAAPEEYSWSVDLEAGETLTQVGETDAVVTGPLVEDHIWAAPVYDHHGTPVPTTLAVSGDVITLTVQHREGTYAYPVSTETPEELDTAPIREYDGFGFPAITGPESPERYPFRVTLGEEQELRPVSATEAGVFYGGHVLALTLIAEKAHDAVGASVPTTLEVTGPDVVTLVVDHRAGNPLSGGAPFVYPINEGEGWEGGFRTVLVPMPNPDGEPAEPAPAPGCKVPSLRGLTLRAAKARLRSHHCAIGAVRLGRGASDGKGKVVKQFRGAGSNLPAGTTVAVKLGPR